MEVTKMSNENKMLEEAKACERQAKELRKKAKELKELNHLKLLAQYGEIVAEAAGIELVELGLAGFRRYALNEGRIYIKNAVASTVTTA
jgi:hypothetical protein